jgi:hypothetical protein
MTANVYISEPNNHVSAMQVLDMQAGSPATRIFPVVHHLASFNRKPSRPSPDTTIARLQARTP